MPQQPASSSTTSAPGIRCSSATVAAVPASAFWWQWPWKRMRRGPWSRSFSAPSSIASTSSSSTRRVRPATPRSPSSATCSSRSVSRHEGSTPVIVAVALRGAP